MLRRRILLLFFFEILTKVSSSICLHEKQKHNTTCSLVCVRLCLVFLRAAAAGCCVSGHEKELFFSFGRAEHHSVTDLCVWMTGPF